jgi:hypothetical protein
MIANDVNLVTLTVDGKVITGGYGGRRYYPDYVLQGCGNNLSLRPTWVLDKDMYQSKEHCCSENFMPGRELLGDEFPHSATHIVPVDGAEHDDKLDAKQDAKCKMPSDSPPPPPTLANLDTFLTQYLSSTLGWVSINGVASTLMEVTTQGLCAKDESHLVQIVRTA